MTPTPSSLPRISLLAALLAVGATASSRLARDDDKRGIEAVEARVLDAAIDALHEKVAADAQTYVDHSSWDDPWVVASEHYEVRSTWSRAYAKEIGAGLDKMFGYFVELAQPDIKLAGKAKVFVLPDQPTYNKFGDDHGDHHSSILGSFYASAHPDKAIATCWHPNKTLVQMWATHSAWHHFAQNAFPGVQHPAPLDEGLAAYFAAFWDWNWIGAQCDKLVAARRYIPLRKLLRDASDAYGSRANDYFVQFAMLYRFMRYEYPPSADVDGAPGPFTEFVRLALAGRDTRKSPVHAMVFDDPRALDSAFRAMLDKRQKSASSK